SLTKSESKLSHSKCCSAETARKRAFALQMLLGGNRPKASFRTPNAARRKRPESKLSHSKCCPASALAKASFRTPNAARPKDSGSRLSTPNPYRGKHLLILTLSPLRENCNSCFRFLGFNRSFEQTFQVVVHTRYSKIRF